MKQLINIILFVLIAYTASAQQITVSPVSTPMWGTTPWTSSVSISYSDFRVTIVRPIKKFDKLYYKGNHVGSYKGIFLGVSYNPLSLSVNKIDITSGVGIFHRPFPNKDIGQRLYFNIQVSYQITSRISLTYKHRSNGFGIWNKVNPGLDNIGLSVSLK